MAYTLHELHYVIADVCMLRTTFICTLLMLTLLVMDARAQNADINLAPGVSRSLARLRAAKYRDVRYLLQIELAPGAAMLRGTETIHVKLDGNLDQLVLDWRVAPPKTETAQARVWDVEVNGHPAGDVRHENDHLVIPGAYLTSGENTVGLRFESPIATSGSAVTRYLDREDHSEYIYTLFVPSDASTGFPCFDQPDLKGRFTLEVTAPGDWKVVTNTYAIKGTSRSRFAETEPISTYLFAFAAGPFVEFHDEAASAPPLRVFVRKSKSERARKELSEVFRLNREGLQFLASYFDYKFPFPKYDLVIVPEFAYGGMEHAGATFLREEAILFPTDPTANDLLSRAEVMFHEAAHQWFGDLVTMRWFDDLWLKEGFAEFMAYKAVEAIMPQYNAWKVFYQRIKPAAYLTDATKGTTPIFQEIPNLSAAKSAYGNIVYRKAPSMLRQAEFFLGPDKFQKAIRLYLKEHAYGNAEWADLVRAFERTSGKRLDGWASAWVRTRGMPDVRLKWNANARDRIERLTLREEDALGEGGSWPMRLKLLLSYGPRPPETLTVMLGGTGDTDVREAKGKPRPAYIFANYEDYGYGQFLLDKSSREFVLGHLGAVRDGFLRALLWGSLWDSVRDAELAPSAYIDLALKLLPSENDEVSVQSILGRTSTAFNRYLSESQMQEVAPRLEHLLAERMMNAETLGLRITYFRGLQSLATTGYGRDQLKKILRGEVAVPSMTLRPRDRFDIITALLARKDGEAPALMKGQSAATDDEKRYAFAAGAARADEGVKKIYFDSFLNDTTLAESWIEAGVGPFNTIRQSDLTLPYLEAALRELPHLKRTRKIFFVNDWLAAFIGGQCSDRALGTVRQFLTDEVSLDRDLRLKVLEVEDGLERCVRIRTNYQGGGR
jgi:aminopeptidase N